MRKKMIGACVLLAALTAVFAGLYHALGWGFLLSLAITFGTTAYHFWVRLLVGTVYDLILRNQVDYRKSWFSPKSWEKPLYEKLKVKQWKNKMPTFAPDAFDPRIHSWEEIARAMCQSELVHETNALVSLLAILGSVWFGAFWVFFLTSLAGALFDLSFVAIQRYNRPRVVRLAEREVRG